MVCQDNGINTSMSRQNTIRTSLHDIVTNTQLCDIMFSTLLHRIIKIICDTINIMS